MGFFKNLFRKNNTLNTFENKAYNIPDIIANCTNPNPYRGKYREHGIDNAVYLLYADYSTAERWIKDSQKPDTYFSNYIKAVQILDELTKYSRKHYFRKPTPAELLDELKANYYKLTNKLINNYWNATLTAADKLKTDKGKTNKKEKFFETLLTVYRQYLVKDNITHIEELRANKINQYIEKEKIAVTCKNYDVNSIDGISAIPEKDYEAMRLLQKAATNHKRNGDILLAVECLRKSNQISDTIPFRSEIPKLTEKEYLRIIKYAKSYNVDSAKIEELNIKKKHPEFWDKRISNLKLINETLKHCQSMNTDLVEVFTNLSCEICGKYDKKVFSISGKNRKFPKLPDEVKNQTHNCKNCSMTVHSYFDL